MRNYSNLPKCSECSHCKARGKTGKNYGLKRPRKIYYCEHPDADNLVTKYGHPIVPFVGYGDSTRKSPLVSPKTCKNWCPLVEGRRRVEKNPESDFYNLGNGLCNIHNYYDGGD